MIRGCIIISSERFTLTQNTDLGCTGTVHKSAPPEFYKSTRIIICLVKAESRGSVPHAIRISTNQRCLDRFLNHEQDLQNLVAQDVWQNFSCWFRGINLIKLWCE